MNPEILSKAERLQWETAMTREAVNGQVLALESQGSCRSSSDGLPIFALSM